MNKEVKVLPGITLKYGKGGITTSFHFKNQDDETNYKSRVERLRNTLFKQYDAVHEIRSEHTDKLTSNELQQFKDLLIQSNTDYTELSKDLENKQAEYNLVVDNLTKVERSVIKFLLKKKRKRLADESEDLNQQIANLNNKYRILLSPWRLTVKKLIMIYIIMLLRLLIYYRMLRKNGI